MLEPNERCLNLRRQCWLFNVNRSSYYYQALEPSKLNVLLMNEIQELWLRYPFYGYRRITAALKALGYAVNRKRVQRLMQAMGVQALHPKAKTSLKNKAHAVYPYLLADLAITRLNQVWQVDITY